MWGFGAHVETCIFYARLQHLGDTCLHNPLFSILIYSTWEVGSNWSIESIWFLVVDYSFQDTFAQAVNWPSRICFYSFGHIPRILSAGFAPLGFQVSSFCQLIFRRWRAQGAQAVNWTSRICFHGFAHIPSVHFAWCVPLGFQVSSFVNWYLGGGGHNLHSLWTVLRAYVFIASRISQHTFGLMCPFGSPD